MKPLSLENCPALAKNLPSPDIICHCVFLFPGYGCPEGEPHQGYFPDDCRCEKPSIPELPSPELSILALPRPQEPPSPLEPPTLEPPPSSAPWPDATRPQDLASLTLDLAILPLGLV